LTEKFIADPAQPVSIAAAQQVTRYTRDVLAQSAFKFTLPENGVAVGTGGSVTTVRAILGAREGKPFESSDAVVTVAQLRELLAWLGALPLEVRKQVPGLPPARADVFPTALATLIAVAEAGNLSAFQNSVYNLRYGLAAEALRLD
jgi:exopolyphosphatase/guanosine-5'-triphosphate,3'-diphosphate pyrophosphatase